jgi:ankyrin repeat protein
VYVAASGLTILADTLVDHGVSVNTPDLDLATPLHYACQMSGSADSDERDMGGAMVKKLLALGAELNLIDNQGRTVHWAAAAGASGSCDLLVRAGAKLQAVDRDNLTRQSITHHSSVLCNIHSPLLIAVNCIAIVLQRCTAHVHEVT